MHFFGLRTSGSAPSLRSASPCGRRAKGEESRPLRRVPCGPSLAEPNIMPPYALWIVFGVVVLGIMVLDLAIVHRRAHRLGIREAAIWTGFCIGTALLFNLFVAFTRGRDQAFDFLSAYLTEEALSIDNLFVFLIIFSYFRVPPENQHRVLFWGILGALVFRAVAIGAGVVLVRRFHAILYVFGAILVWTAFKLLRKDESVDPGKNIAIRLVRRFYRVTEGFRGEKFFVFEGGRRFATPLFVVLLVIESSDIMFALDSIPAVFGISQDPFIIYTSNVFAILGLRSLYFVLSHLMARLRFLRFGLSVILFFVGLKMLGESWVKVPSFISLLVIASVLTVTTLLSFVIPARPESESRHAPGPPAPPAAS